MKSLNFNLESSHKCTYLLIWQNFVKATFQFFSEFTRVDLTKYLINEDRGVNIPMLKLISRKKANIFHHYFLTLISGKIGNLEKNFTFSFFSLPSSFYVIRFHIKNSKSFYCTALIYQRESGWASKSKIGVSKIDSLSWIITISIDLR